MHWRRKMYENRIKHLKESHHVLDKRIDAMEKDGHFTDPELVRLKKERLKFKDEIAKMEALQAKHVDKTHHND